MRFMMLMIPKGYESAPKGAMPDAKMVAAMMKYNEELRRAGVLLALDGLHPPSDGARVTVPGGKPRVTDGPFAEAKEVLGGFNIIEAADMNEALEIAMSFPWADTGSLEVRPIRDIATVARRVGASEDQARKLQLT